LKIQYRCRAVDSLSRSEDAGDYITKLPKAEHEAADGRQRWRP